MARIFHLGNGDGTKRHALCGEKRAAQTDLRRPRVTKDLWESRHKAIMGLDEAVELCRTCYRLAPFCLYNGNTFSSIVSLVIRKLELTPQETHLLRSLAGHIVAGVASDEEERAFREFCASLG